MMTGLRSAICDVELTGTAAPQWVQLFPAGRMTGRDGRVFDLADPAAVILDFEGRGVDLPVDYEHQLDDGKPRTGPVPAAGWLKELKADARGLWGRVEWTATAAELIGQKAYRYLSPSFLFSPSTAQVVRLTGAGLVHKPNLHLKALAREEPTMKDTDTADPAAFMARLVTALGLPTDATADAVAGLVERMVAQLRKIAGGPATATASELAGGKPDPALYVPMDVMQSLASARATERAEVAAGRAAEKVRVAMDRGYLTPAMRDWALALCRSDEASFDTFLAKSGATFAALHRELLPNRPPAAARGTADAPDGSLAAAVCAQLGLKPGTLAD